MMMAMKMSPSVMAASETWLAIAQDTIEPVNQGVTWYHVSRSNQTRCQPAV